MRIHPLSSFLGASLAGLVVLGTGAFQSPSSRILVDPVPESPQDAPGRIEMTTAPVPGAPRRLKILGQPAASDFFDIESNALGGDPVNFVVPEGKWLGTRAVLRFDNEPGTVNGRIRIDGKSVLSVSLNGTGFVKGAQSTWHLRPGQVLTVERVDGGGASPAATFVVRCWLEGGPGSTKLAGVPAVAEWRDIESNTLGAPAIQYVVPKHKVMVPSLAIRPGEAPPGGIDGRVFVNGNYVGSFSMTGGAPTLLPGPTWYAREGETVTIERTGGSAAASETFFLRCWMEDVFDG